MNTKINDVNSEKLSFQETGRRAYSEQQRQFRAKLYDDVLEHYKYGVPIKKIAKFLNTTVNQVYRCFQDLGLERRKGLNFCRILRTDKATYAERGETTIQRFLYSWYYGDFPRDWHVHHIDCDKRNNRPHNLLAMPCSVHHHLHALIRKGDTEGVTTILTEYLQKRREARHIQNG